MTPFQEFVDSLGMTLVDVDRAMVKLKGFHLRQKFKSMNVVVDLVKNQYL